MLLSNPVSAQWAEDYGATSLGAGERLFWRFDPAPTGADRGWTGPIGYACRIETSGQGIAVDRYRVQYGGGDYMYLEPLEGVRVSGGTVSDADPKSEEHIVSEAVMTEGNFWFANNMGMTPEGYDCLDHGIDRALESLQ